MATAKEIQNRKKSIADTMKITKAMYIISSAKLQKAKKNLKDTEPYFYGLQDQISRILRHTTDFKHQYFGNREEDVKRGIKSIAYIVVSADKGMAGAYNHNIFRKADELISQNPDKAKLYVVGELGRQYFTSHGYDITEEFRYTAQNPTMHRARVITEHFMDLFDNDELDEIHIIYTQMINSLTSEVVNQQLLPLKKKDFTINLPSNALTGTMQEEFHMVPSAKDIFESIVPNYVTGMIYGALIESYSSEQNARMQAMQAATDSAEKMMHDLSIQYNRVRQGAITQEITEVVGGARALERNKEKAAKEEIV